LQRLALYIKFQYLKVGEYVIVFTAFQSFVASLRRIFWVCAAMTLSTVGPVAINIVLFDFSSICSRMPDVGPVS
jgi:hypothetical protein